MRSVILGLIQVVLISASFNAQAEPWPVKEFEVIGVVPKDTELNLTFEEYADQAYRLLRETGVVDPYLPELFLSIDIDPEVRASIEVFLHDAAVRLEAWGFEPPALKPLVTNSAGRPAYRVYLITNMNAAGKYRPSCEVSTKQILLLNDIQVMGALTPTPRGYATIAHELFHAVQYGSEFYRCVEGNRSIGSWITEGQAGALGWDIAQMLRPMAYPSFADERWGERDYARRLQVIWAKPRPVDPYGTSSFWRYLAERTASAGGARPGPQANPVDYSYLPPMLAQLPVRRDCRLRGQPCEEEIDWLDSRLRATFRQSLRFVYTNFLEALTLYGTHRPGLGSQQDWQDAIYKKQHCENFIFDGNYSRSEVTKRFTNFEENSGRCMEVRFNQFNDMVKIKLEATASGSQVRLEDLTAAVADKPIHSFRPDVYLDPETGNAFASWIFDLPAAEPSYLVLANVANRPSETEQIPNLPYTIKVLEEYAFMNGGSGPSGADVDAPLPFELPDIRQSLVMPGPLEQHVEEGLENVCMLQFQFSNLDTGDGLLLKMDQEGPFEPGTFNVHAGGDFSTEEFPGEFVVLATVGHGNPLGQGWQLNYQGLSGTITLDSVSRDYIEGHASLLLKYSPVRDCEDPMGRKPALGNNIRCPDGLESIVINPRFAVVPEMTRGAEKLGKSIEQCTGERPLQGSSRPSSPPSGLPPVPGNAPPVVPPPPPGPQSGGPNEGSPPSAPPAPGGEVSPGGTPVEGQGEGHPIDESSPRWFRVHATGDVETAVHVSNPQMTGGCSGSSPFSLGLLQSDPTREDYAYLSFSTQGAVATGAVGEFALSELKWDFGSVSPENMPPELNIRVPNRFSGTGTLELTSHIASPELRRMTGVIHAEGLTNHPGQSVDIEASFGVDWSCGIQ